MISGHRVVALSGWRLNVRYGAQSVGSLPRSDTSEVGGEGDMPRRPNSRD